MTRDSKESQKTENFSDKYFSLDSEKHKSWIGLIKIGNEFSWGIAKPSYCVSKTAEVPKSQIKQTMIFELIIYKKIYQQCGNF